LEFGVAVGAVGQVLVLFVYVSDVELLGDLVGAVHPGLQRAGVVGNDALQGGGQVEGDRGGEGEHHDAAGDPDLMLMAPERSHAF